MDLFLPVSNLYMDGRAGMMDLGAGLVFREGNQIVPTSRLRAEGQTTFKDRKATGTTDIVVIAWHRGCHTVKAALERRSGLHVALKACLDALWRGDSASIVNAEGLYVFPVLYRMGDFQTDRFGSANLSLSRDGVFHATQQVPTTYDELFELREAFAFAVNNQQLARHSMVLICRAQDVLLSISEQCKGGHRASIIKTCDGLISSDVLDDIAHTVEALQIASDDDHAAE